MVDSSSPEHVDFFISYRSDDVTWARWLVGFLEPLGYTTRYQERDFPIGKNFVAAMHDGVVEARAVIALLTEAYEASSYTKEEWTAAHNDEDTNLIPVLVEDFEPRGTLGTLSRIEIVGLDRKEAEDKLRTALQRYEPSRRDQRYRLGSAKFAYPGTLHPVAAASAPLLGRDQYLDSVDEKLNEGDMPVVIIPDEQHVVGRGCTALAADYVRSNAAKFDLVAWIHAAPAELIELEYLRLGRELALPPEERTIDGVNEELTRLARRGRTLVVFDGAPERGKVQPWLPGPPVDRIITTSNRDSYVAADAEHLIELGSLDPTEASRALETEVRYDATEVLELTRKLDNDPQAVALAVAYLGAVEGVTIAEYLKLIDPLLATADGPAGAATALALDQLMPAGVEFLALLGHGAARPVPIVALAKAGDTGSRVLNEALQVDATRARMLEELTRLGLAYEVLASIAISTRAGADALNRLPDTDRHAIADAAVELFGSTLEAAVNDRAWDLADQIAPHSYVAIQNAKASVPAGSAESTTKSDSLLTGEVQLSRYFAEVGLTALARSTIQPGLELLETNGSFDAALGIAVLRTSADVYRAAGEREKAIGDLEAALGAVPEADTAGRARVLVELGDVQASDGQRAAAEASFAAAEKLVEEADAKAVKLALMGAKASALELWNEPGDLETAEKLADDRYEFATEWQGQGEGTVAALADRGRLRRKLDRPDEAAADLRQAIEQHEKRGEDLRLAGALGEYAAALSSLAATPVPEADIVACAAALREQNLDLYNLPDADEAPAGEGPPNDRRLPEAVTPGALSALQLYDEAQLALARAAAIYARRRGRRSGEVGTMLERLADIYDVVDEPARAAELRRRAGAESMPMSPGVPEELATLKKPLRDAKCTPIVGPGLTNRLFTPRADIAERWAEAEEYPLERYHHRQLPNVAEFLAVTKQDQDVRSSLKAHIADELMKRYDRGLPFAVKRDDADLEDVIAAVGCLARWRDPFEHHSVVAALPAEIYVVAGASDLLFDALVEQGKEPKKAICDWRTDRTEVGAPSALYKYTPSKERPLVLNIFGHLSQEGSVVLTERDYIQFIIELSKGEKVLPHEVRKAVTENSLLILGFGLQDWDFHVLFQSLLDRPGDQLRKELPGVAVNVSDESVWIDPSRARQYLQEYFRRRKVTLLPYDLDAMIQHLARMPAALDA